ncbi:hypothetical protein VNO78_05577 [Psophocarpus tetragonolobus]|uniref:Cytochrome P450 n=1 Tax=Psophocarpus tetragonolobus TaxID=3891 RepID=A0AAN9T0Y3_PSOTE
MFLSACLLKLLFDRTHTPKAYLKHPPSPPGKPIIGHLHLLKPLIHHAFRELSLRYGPLLWLRLGSVKFLVVSTPTLAREFLKTNEQNDVNSEPCQIIDLAT